jgi:hypothetical protein
MAATTPLNQGPKRSDWYELRKPVNLVAIAGLAVGVVSVILAVLAIHASWDIAKLSGAFDRPDITLGLGGVPAQPGPVAVIYGAPHVGEENSVVIGSLPFTFNNASLKTADNATLTVRYPKFLGRSALEAMQFSITGSVAAVDLQRSLTSDGTFDYSSYQAKTLNPGVNITINEPLYVRETQLQTKVPFITKDGVHGTVSVNMRYSIQWLATVSARDVTAANYELDVAATRASSMNNLVSFAEARAIPDEIENLRKKLTFQQYLGGLLFRSVSGSLFLVFQTNIEHDVGNGRLFSPDSTAQVGRMEFSLLSWGSLFR